MLQVGGDFYHTEMKITLYTVGKIKESFYRDAIREFEKRLSRYCRLQIIEVADEKTPDHAGDALCRQIRDREGTRLLEKIPSDTVLYVLDIPGKRYTSEGFAGQLQEQMLNGRSDVGFVIGGSLGLSDSVLARAEQRISFSDMTFPHQLMRVILLEQIYRAFRIINGEPYHK